MNGSWYIGKLAGIDVRIHWTFLLLPVWIYFSNLAAGSGAAAATISVIFVLAIFGCVVLHELGHALTARRFGIPTRDITLLPIGGVASLQRIPRNPIQELAIALAGPAVNVVIAAALFVGLGLRGEPVSEAALFLSRLAWVNVGLVVFNMIPAFPMDGGRVLRSILALMMPYRQATSIASGVGQLAAAGLGLLGLLSGNLLLVFVAGFVFLAARGELLMVNQTVPHPAMDYRHDGDHTVRTGELVYIGDRVPPANGLEPRPAVDADWTAQSALGWLSAKPGDEFPVFKGSSRIGEIRKSDLHFAIVSGKGHWPIEHLLAIRYLPPRGFRPA
jgi:Zn-dependent protease